MHYKSRLSVLKGFRPFCILPCLFKVFEILKKEQVMEYLDVRAYFDEYQSGFRKRHSTGTAPLHVSDEIINYFQKKTFDMLNHEAVLSKLAIEVWFFFFSKLRLGFSQASLLGPCCSLFISTTCQTAWTGTFFLRRWGAIQIVRTQKVDF